MFRAVVAETDDIETGKKEDEEKNRQFTQILQYLNGCVSLAFISVCGRILSYLCYTKEVCVK